MIRFENITNYLLNEKFTFIFLQEVWVSKEYRKLSNDLEKNYPYSKFFESGIIGSGMCIFSIVPIIHSFFVPFEANGYFYKLWHGDWFSGKGVGVCRVEFNNYMINLIITHTHVETKGLEYVPHRLTQAVCLVDLINLCSDAADLTIMGCDLNCDPEGQLVKLLLALTDLKDAYKDAEYIYTNPSLLTGTYEDIGGTCGLPTNYYTNKSYLKKNPNGWRLDYILFKATNSNLFNLIVKNYFRPLPNCIPGKKFSYSDHEGILVEFEIQKFDKNKINDIFIRRPSGFLKQLPLLRLALQQINASFRVLQLRMWICVTFGLFISVVLLSTLYFPSISITVTVIMNLLRIILSTLAFVLGVVQPLHIRQEMHALRAAYTSLKYKESLASEYENNTNR